MLDAVPFRRRRWRDPLHVLRTVKNTTPSASIAPLGSAWKSDFLPGFVDLEYIDAGPDGSRSGVSTFDNHHANIFVETELRPNLGGHLEVEYEHSGEIVEIDQAYVEWAATDWLSLTAGRFYTPFGIERFVWYSPTNALVSRPEPMRQLIPGNFYANGVMAAGNFGVGESSAFTWELALSDGLGDLAASSRRGSRQTRDNNSNRALSGRLGFAPIPHFELGTSYHQQRYSTDGDLGLDFLGFDLSGRFRGFELRAEWVPIWSEAAPPDLRQEGYYTQLAYTFHRATTFLPAVSLVGRWDVVDLDRDITGNNDQELFSFGVNTALYQHLRFKLEYRWISEDGPARDNNTFLSQFVIDF